MFGARCACHARLRRILPAGRGRGTAPAARHRSRDCSGAGEAERCEIEPGVNPVPGPAAEAWPQHRNRRSGISLNQELCARRHVLYRRSVVLDPQCRDARVMHAHPAANRKALQIPGFSLAVASKPDSSSQRSSKRQIWLNHALSS